MGGGGCILIPLHQLKSMYLGLPVYMSLREGTSRLSSEFIVLLSHGGGGVEISLPPKPSWRGGFHKWSLREGDNL